MDIFVYGLHSHSTPKRLKSYFYPKLKEFGIEVFELEKLRNNTCALLTVLDKEKGQMFLEAYAHGARRYQKLKKPFNCKRSNTAPEPLKIQGLQKKTRDLERITALSKQITVNQPPIPQHDLPRPHPLHQGSTSLHDTQAQSLEERVESEARIVAHSLYCGVWGYAGDQLAFVPHLKDKRTLSLNFGKEMLAIIMWEEQGHAEIRLDIPYRDVNNIYAMNEANPLVNISLFVAPRIYLLPSVDAMIAAFKFHGPRLKKAEMPKRIRVSGYSPEHETIAGTCLVYQMSFTPENYQRLKSYLHKKSYLPQIANWPFQMCVPRKSFNLGMSELVYSFRNHYPNLDFGIKFQLQKLAQNGYLPPPTVVNFIPELVRLAENVSCELTTQCLRKMFNEIPFAGPESEARAFTLESICQLFQDCLPGARRESEFLQGVLKRYRHLTLIHRVRVTPCGIYLEGPELESKNHILREHSEHAFASFIRVSLEDEDGGPIRYDRNGSLEKIHFDRFKQILERALVIGGERFEFLGFSHSSLRDQTCWYMKPFFENGTLMTATGLLASLGDFSAIRSPAKCAARIGQAFTDLNSFVKITPEMIRRVPDVERHGRVFSDGCSSASYSIIQKIGDSFRHMKFKPTVYQIRLGGIKGMISLDKRLKGDVLCVRPSQNKFPAPLVDLGICGSAKRALPFYLNSPLIKILEDLGVPVASFTALQEEAVTALRETAQSPINAANFLERHDIGSAVQLPWLLKHLHYMDLRVLEDDHFLWLALEMAIIIRLRDLKHRMRIPVEKGVTLFGVMDETDTLAEDEVYISALDRDPIRGTVAITRSPTMHPGDVQMVRSVNVGGDSPLKKLYNCVVFSQRGQRDLPSQLSGGDLDGDIFNIIYDPRLMPKKLVPPADYPRPDPVDIGRRVGRADIIRFMIDFISQDQLGRISNVHLQVADLKPDGTLNPDCIKLAAMHSVAVDFSKTGIPADVTDVPWTKYRPDFMARSPRVLISKGKPTFEPEQSLDSFMEDEFEEDVVEALDGDIPKAMFYESKKALGVLYRNIDERRLMLDFENERNLTDRPKQDIIKCIWEHIASKTQLIQYSHLREWAVGVMDEYEAAISDFMITYSPDPRRPLTEVEVFVGNILGRDGDFPSKRVRQEALTMRERYAELVEYTITDILRGEDQEEAGEEALERSIACFRVAVEKRDANSRNRAGTHATEDDGDDGGDDIRHGRLHKLGSFRYVAAMVCLRQVQIFCRNNNIDPS